MERGRRIVYFGILRARGTRCIPVSGVHNVSAQKKKRLTIYVSSSCLIVTLLLNLERLRKASVSLPRYLSLSLSLSLSRLALKG